jgi:acyl dehydratase
VNAHRLRARNLSPDSDNKIHDDEVARKHGFVGALVPGVEVFAYATHPFAEQWGEEFLRRGVIDVRFRKPVYDGDEVEVAATPADGGHAFTVTGPDGVVRSVGRAALAEAAPDIDIARYPDIPGAESRPPADADSLSIGTRLGNVREQISEQTHRAYREGVSDALPLYEQFVHPGMLLRVVNAVLHRNVKLGPWIHVASSCRLIEPAPLPATLTGRGTVTDRYDKDGRSWVRYDALVLAGERPVLQVDHLAIYDLGDPR